MALPTLRFTKDQLIEALEARRPWAVRLDAKRLKAHQAAEKKALAAFHSQCRNGLAEKDYSRAKERFTYRGKERPELRTPECPSSLVASLDRHLGAIRATRQASMQVGSSGQWSGVHYLLTYDETINPEMC